MFQTKLFHIHAVKAYKKRRRVAPIIQNLSTRWKGSLSGRFIPGGKQRKPIIGVWVCPRALLNVLHVRKLSCPYQDRAGRSLGRQTLATNSVTPFYHPIKRVLLRPSGPSTDPKNLTQHLKLYNQKCNTYFLFSRWQSSCFTPVLLAASNISFF